jgi:hypothetical protein
MAMNIPIRFAVMPENEVEAVAHLAATGHAPTKIERDDKDSVYLMFPPTSEVDAWKLMEALPRHLSAKIGFVMRAPPALHRRWREGQLTVRRQRQWHSFEVVI